MIAPKCFAPWTNIDISPSGEISPWHSGCIRCKIEEDQEPTEW